MFGSDTREQFTNMQRKIDILEKMITTWSGVIEKHTEALTSIGKVIDDGQRRASALASSQVNQSDALEKMLDLQSSCIKALATEVVRLGGRNVLGS